MKKKNLRFIRQTVWIDKSHIAYFMKCRKKSKKFSSSALMRELLDKHLSSF